VESLRWMRDDMVSIHRNLRRVFLIFSEGRTSSTDGDDGDLSIDVLVADFCAILESVFPDPASAPTFLVWAP
jgi:hypothetical protein